MEDLQAVEALPIVVIRNYASKGRANREALLSVLASWAVSLTENQVSDFLLHCSVPEDGRQVAHVIVISDNRENSKLLAKGWHATSFLLYPISDKSIALPSKPLNSIALYNADAASALSFVQQKLKDAGIDQPFTPE
jgi:hypothetical protein